MILSFLAGTMVRSNHSTFSSINFVWYLPGADQKLLVKNAQIDVCVVYILNKPFVWYANQYLTLDNLGKAKL